MLAEVFLVIAGVLLGLLVFAAIGNRGTLLLFCGVMMLIFGYYIYSDGIQIRTGANTTTNTALSAFCDGTDCINGLFGDNMTIIVQGLTEETDPLWTGNSSLVCWANGTNCTGGGGNPFDQSLNTTDNVSFNSLTAANICYADGTNCTASNPFDQSLNTTDNVNFSTVLAGNICYSNGSNCCAETFPSETFTYETNPYLEIGGGTWTIVGDQLNGVMDENDVALAYYNDTTHYSSTYKEVTTNFSMSSTSPVGWNSVLAVIDLQDPSGTGNHYSCWEQFYGGAWYLGIYSCNQRGCVSYDTVASDAGNTFAYDTEYQMTFIKNGTDFYCEIPGVSSVSGSSSAWSGGYEGLGVYTSNVTFDNTIMIWNTTSCVGQSLIPPATPQIWLNDTTRLIINSSYPQNITIKHMGLNDAPPDGSYLMSNQGAGSDWIEYFWDSSGGQYYQWSFAPGPTFYTPNSLTMRTSSGAVTFASDWNSIYLDPGQAGSYYYSQANVKIGQTNKGVKLQFGTGWEPTLGGWYDTELRRAANETLQTNGNFQALNSVQTKQIVFNKEDASELLYYKLDEMPGSGTNVIDSSPQGINGTATFWSEGRNFDGAIGNGYIFSVWGWTNYIDTNQDAAFQFGSNDFTLSARIKNSAPGESVVVGKYNGTGDYYSLGNDASGNAFFEIGGARATQTMLTSNWYMMTGTRRGNNIYVCVDTTCSAGVDVTGLTADAGGNLRIGKRGEYGDYPIYLDSVDEIRVFNRSLSDGEIADLFHSTLGNNVTISADGFSNGATENVTYLQDLTTTCTMHFVGGIYVGHTCP